MGATSTGSAERARETKWVARASNGGGLAWAGSLFYIGRFGKEMKTMKSFWALVMFTATGLLTLGCEGGGTTGTAGSGGSGASGGGGTAGSGGAGGMTSSGTTTSPSCDGLIENPNECGLCVEGQCCVPLQACLQDDVCAACLQGGMPDPACDTNELIQGINTCVSQVCPDLCGTTTDPACDAPAVAPSMGACVAIDGTNVKCNPLTNEGCDAAAGESCDATAMMGFQCFPDNNTQAVCDPCGDAEGYCSPGSTCLGTCAKFCCDDGDCGSGTCVKGDFGDPDVGYCALAM